MRTVYLKVTSPPELTDSVRTSEDTTTRLAMAGSTSRGSELAADDVLEAALRQGRVVEVLVAEDASERTLRGLAEHLLVHEGGVDAAHDHGHAALAKLRRDLVGPGGGGAGAGDAHQLIVAVIGHG